MKLVRLFSIALFLLSFPRWLTASPHNTINAIDGIVDAEWTDDELRVDDPLGDSGWGSENEIDDLYLTWDADNLYVGLRGNTEHTPHQNAIHLAIDLDPGIGTGETDFRAGYVNCLQNCKSIASGWGAEYMYVSDAMARGELYRLDSTTHVETLVGILAAASSDTIHPRGYELAVDWNTLYELGDGHVPPGCRIGLVVILGNAAGTYCSPESAPDWVYGSYSNGFLTFDQFSEVIVDGDGDGVPDDLHDGIPGVDANGDPFEWKREQVKAVDPWDDDGDSGFATRDLIAFYYAELDDRLVFRADLGSIWDGGDDSPYLDVYMAIDYTDGGSTDLPNSIAGISPVAWDRCLLIEGPEIAQARLWIDPMVEAPPSAIKAISFSPEPDMVEASLWRAPLGSLRDTLQFYVYTVRDGQITISDDLVTTSHSTSGIATVAFVHHGNQSLTGTSVVRGWDGPHSGFDEVLEAHDSYGIKGNFHFSGTLQTATEWFDPDFNDWLEGGTASGRYCLITSAYAQHIMPFVNDEMNDWALVKERELIDHFYGHLARVAWVPERVWVTPSGISGGVNDDIIEDWQEAGIEAVILDDSPHGDNLSFGTQRHKLWQINRIGAPKVFLRDGIFTGYMHSGADIHSGIVPYFVAFANALDQEQYILYADDWEVTAEEGGFRELFPTALEIYRQVMRYLGAHPWIRSVSLEELLGAGWSVGNFDVTEGTYFLIGGYGGYGGGNNSWYTHWASWVPFAAGGQGAPAYGGSSGNRKNYEEIWQHACQNLVDSHTGGGNLAADALIEAGWFTMMANLYETGWHDGMGEPISGWEHKHSAHIKNANVFAAGARWADDPPLEAVAFLDDVDDDGYTELVIQNDRLMAVFDRIGGCARWIFDSEGHVVVGNDMAYWNSSSLEYPPGSGIWHDDAGDYSDGSDGFNWGNQTGALTDNWMNDMDHERTPYEVEIDVDSGTTVQATLSDGAVTKVIRLSSGAQHVEVVYTSIAGSSTNYMISGFSPHVLDLIEYGRVHLVKISRDGMYAGWLNQIDDVVGALIFSQGGAVYNGGYDNVLCKVEQLKLTSGDRFYLYAGPGDVETLDSLAENLSSVEETDIGAPEDFVLKYNYPNPFNSTTVIRYHLSSMYGSTRSRVTLRVYNVLGQVVRTLADELQTPGHHLSIWDGKDDGGHDVASGMYVCCLRFCGRCAFRRMVLVR